MRQGQQNRRGRGRGGNNNSNANRKPQNPLSRTYESSGPDVKIRGTASQIAEKYSTLARDASSSGDVIMAENYLQHAEHYNRIIMAAQAQSSQSAAHNGNDVAHALNGAHRSNRDLNGPPKDQPQPYDTQPVLTEQPSETQPDIRNLKTDDQPLVEEKAAKDRAPAKEEKKETDKGQTSSEPDSGRRRRKRYTNSSANGAPASDMSNDKEKSSDVAEDGQSADEITAQ